LVFIDKYKNDFDKIKKESKKKLHSKEKIRSFACEKGSQE